MRNERAKKIAEQIHDAFGYATRVWSSDDDVPIYRVYVARDLSRRRQEMGYVEIDRTGEVHGNGLTRRAAGIMSAIQD